MSWTDYDENSWEYQAGKALSTMKCDGPFKNIVSSFDELYDSDQFDSMARKAMAKLNRKGAPAWGIDDQVELLARKQRDYGHDNIDRFGVTGVRVRLWDKVSRYNNLAKHNWTVENEPVQDTLFDIIGYCTIYAMVKNGTFSFPLSTDMKEQA